MAQQNVCEYFKFGYCKFLDTCRLMHIKEKCENQSCEIKSCNLRHPRTCKFYRDYRRCKYSEWCSYEHVENENENLVERINNLEKVNAEKDILIKALADKIKTIEEKLNLDLHDSNDDSEMERTFFNPLIRYQCDECDFVAKSSAGLQSHVKSKHVKMAEKTDKDTDIIVVEIHDLEEGRNVQKDVIESQDNDEFETLVIHAHAPPNEQHTPKLHRIDKKFNKLNVETPLRKYLERLKEVQKVKHVIVEPKPPFSRMFRPTTIEIEVKKSDIEKFSDIEAFIKKIGLYYLPDTLPENYPTIPQQ